MKMKMSFQQSRHSDTDSGTEVEVTGLQIFILIEMFVKDCLP